jgi:hypothetical protein
MLIDGDEYKPSMVKFLNTFSNKNRTLNEQHINYLENLFKNFLVSTQDLTKKAFFSESGRFATLFFEATFAACCKNAFNNKSFETLKFSSGKITNLFQDKEFRLASQTDTASVSNVKIRLERAKIVLGA